MKRNEMCEQSVVRAPNIGVSFRSARALAEILARRNDDPTLRQFLREQFVDYIPGIPLVVPARPSMKKQG